MLDTTVLIVDDESRMRKLIKDFLAQKGYKTIEAIPTIIKNTISQIVTIFANFFILLPILLNIFPPSDK